MSIASLTAQNLLSPVVLFFLLGLGAALARSDLAVPEAVAKFLALYLLLAIGFRGGVEVSHHGFDWPMQFFFFSTTAEKYFLRICSQMTTLHYISIT